jgi:NADH-quinone oxidoreductase subunit N
MLAALVAQAVTAAGPFNRPTVDWHALAPEIVIVATAAVIILVDVVLLEDARRYVPAITGLGLLGAYLPLVTLAVDGATRDLFGGAYVVDKTSLLLKALFLLTGYIVVLLSTNFIAEGDYWESEYYLMVLCSIIGMVVMSSARDFITIFVALELLSLPAYLMATWNKRDNKSNEAGLKYYLMGVFASALMLYGMSLIFGVAGRTILKDIAPVLAQPHSSTPIITVGVAFTLMGFGFKVSAVPFHTWAPDTYEGAPTPVTTFLAVASKAAGFVALLQLIRIGFIGRADVVEPLMWILSAASMTVGNLIALRQNNVVRMLAYSGVAQAGFMLAPFAVISGGNAERAFGATIAYLVIYAAMNLGAFAVVIAAARKTQSAELESYSGLFRYAPGLTVVMTICLASLAGIPPMGGWYAKFAVFRALLGPGTTWATILAVVMAVNSVISFYYYGLVLKRMWMDEPYLGDVAPVRVPPSLFAALAITTVATLAFGVAPGIVTHFSEVPVAAVAAP